MRASHEHRAMTPEDPRDVTINKLQRKIEIMDEQRHVFRRNVSSLQGVISSLEEKVKELESLNEAFEVKVKAFESVFQSMSGGGHESSQPCPGATSLSDSCESSDDSSVSSDEMEIGESTAASCRVEI